MHELSIAMSILDVVGEEAARQGDARVSAVHLKLGALSGVVKEALLASFDKARIGTSLEECQLVIQEMPIVIDCATCGKQQPVVSIQQERRSPVDGNWRCVRWNWLHDSVSRNCHCRRPRGGTEPAERSLTDLARSSKRPVVGSISKCRCEPHPPVVTQTPQ